MRRICLLMLLLVQFSVYADTVLITGGLGGVGRAIAEAYLQEGWQVWVTSRNPAKHSELKGAKSLKLEFENDESIRQVVQTVIAHDGQIDVLVNNAGFGVVGPEETISLSQAKSQFDVNFFGPFRLMQEVLPYMRAKHKGHIINVSSTSGIRAVPGLGIYAASKFALEGVSESMAASLHPWNIQITLVEPGTIANQWASNCQRGLQSEEPLYQQFTDNLQAALEGKAKGGQSMKDVASLIVRISNKPGTDFRIQTSRRAHLVAKEVYRDPTGNRLLNKMKNFSTKMYQKKTEIA